MADVAVKSFEFQVVAIGLARESIWKAILGPKIDKGGWDASESGKRESSLIDLQAEFDLVNRFRREMWTWLGDSPSGQIRSYLYRVLEELTVTSLLVPRSAG